MISPPTQNQLGEFPPLSSGRSIEIEDQEYAQVRSARVRIILVLVGFACVVAVLVGRLAQIAVLKTPPQKMQMASNVVKYRADITDRHGELLATTLETYSLYVNPKKVWDPVASTEAITSVLPDLDAADVEEKLTSGKSFYWLKRNLSPSERQKVFALGLPELAFEIEPKRVYPRGKLAAHVLGFTDIDLNGTAGVEKAFDARLSDPKIGPLALSLDMKVQFAVEDELQNGMEKYKAEAAVGIVLNIKTGELLAMASFPTFDPNQSGAASPYSRLNRASMQLYELGSTFKPITMALAEENKVLKPDEKLPVQKPLVIQKKLINDDHHSPVPLGIFDILAKSSNRGSALLALRAGADAQQDLLRRLGLFNRVPIELKETAAPLLPPEWQDLTTATVSYGHGISVTPLALATAIGSLLNDGMYVTPTVKKREVGQAIPRKRVLDAQVSQTIQDMMRYVVTNGTGRNAAVPGYELMGKTGTAEKLVNGQYDKKRLVTSFEAAFPHSDPHYLVFVVFDEPKPAADTYGFATAGWNSARVAGKIVERIAPMLGVRKYVANSGRSYQMGGSQ
ncbi:MAG TPA: penicillin-binding protein 2 [Hellea balneolensis]|uniref:Penicillin-binding protein 2 n=1 Tax=Hellea balneolensis TaxID=287478 RepID=A0A7C5M1Q9_9PROT|nr:penicillin-binding protein 2 [Hellea balneolensis]